MPSGRAGPKIHPVTLPGQQAMQRRASRSTEHPHAGLAHPTVGPCHRQDSTAGLCFVFHAHTHIYTRTHIHSRKPAVRNKAGEAIVQASNPPQSLSSHAREDICSLVSPRKWPCRDGRNCCMSWMGLPVSSRPTLTHPGFKRAFYQKAIDMPRKCLSPTCLLLKRWQGAAAFIPRGCDLPGPAAWTETWVWNGRSCFGKITMAFDSRKQE